NYVVLRADCAGNPAFTTLLRRVQATVLGALEHQAYPFNLLVERLQPTRDPSRFPLFQLVFIWDKLRQVGDQDVSPFLLLGLDENAPRMQWDELEVEALAYDQRGAAFDLMLTVFEGRDSLAIALKYNTDLFDADTIKRLLGHFETLLSGIVDQPEQRLAQLPMLTPPEQHEILDLFNATARPYPTDICYHQLFEAQAARTPNAVAVVYDDGAQMTYRELNEQANQLAHQLKRLGVGPGSLIAVYMDRSLEMITALIGIAKAGGAYVPQEPSFPDTRVSWILTSLGVDWIITQHRYQPRLDGLCPPTLRHVIYLDAPPDAAVQDQQPHVGRHTWTWDEMRQLPRENLPPQSSPDDLAYIIFTSGSTGTPKGVMVRHRPVVNLIDWVNRSFAISAADRVLFITSLCFDLSVYDIFGLLAAGGSIRVVANHDLGDPQRLLDMLCNEPVTFWDSAPAALQQLAPLFATLGDQARASRLRLVFLSGDWIPVTLPDQVRDTFPRAEVISLGGATEATVWSNYHPIATVEPHWTSIPYGKPIQNSQYYILDGYLNPCPVGIPGDLYIAGDCLASGYINEPILTATKFIPNPFTAEPGSYLYKTGDQARFWPDGTMEFLGRIDHQVKIRGFRIELGEIEAVLRQHPAVHEAVVIAREDTLAGAKAKRLVAYVVGNGEEQAQDMPGGTAELQSFVKARLPEYMVPAAFVFLERLPVTANGKLDRKALPVPEMSRADLLDDYVAPRTPLEAQLAAIWAEVLQLERVGVEDSFFAIGGHSLVATQIVVRVRDAFQVDVSLRTLLETQTVAALAETIAELQAESAQESSQLPPLEPLNHDQPVPVSFAQERLWFLDQLTPGSSVYVVPWLLRLSGPLDAQALHTALVAL
ncbi:MAG TPA: amino acid adenylation domain-containing protein, partial [Herpetosiphonaceae bacterium]